ncbi:MAG TPA: glycosyltransferase 87 family protein [Devosia sp.]|nr:glycosyltransferase 87 family protein [Devosia sp.]
MRRPVILLLLFSVLALVVTYVGGIRHDYIYYLQQWQLVLDGADPWSGNNAYGPLHNAFALLVPLHPLAPKLLSAACLLLANGMLVLALLRIRPFAAWRDTYLLAFAGNLLILVSAFWFGLNDGFVAALLIGAVLARRDGRLLLAGLLLGLATLDKYYPALLIPFFALDARLVQPRLILAALVTIVLGIGAAIWLWGGDYLEAITYGVSRDATILSIFHPLAVLGRRIGAGDAVDLVVRFNGPLVLLVWLAAIGAAWLRRDNWLTSACWGFFAVLLAYKVGNPQYWVAWLTLVACLPLLDSPDADRLARLSWPYAIFLSLFELGYVVLQPQYYQENWHWIVDSVGVPSTALGLLQLWLWLRVRPASRPTS